MRCCGNEPQPLCRHQLVFNLKTAKRSASSVNGNHAPRRRGNRVNLPAIWRGQSDAMGHLRPMQLILPTSSCPLHPKSDRNAALPLMSAKCHYATLPRLFDHFVGEHKQVMRNGEAECLGRLQVDDEIEFGRLLDGNVGGLLAMQNHVGHIGGTTK